MSTTEPPDDPPVRTRRRRATKPVMGGKAEPQHMNNVVNIMGGEYEPIDPDGVRPNHYERPMKKNGKGRRKTKPKGTTRLSAKMTEIMLGIQEGRYTMKQVCEAMTPEELARGQLKASDGNFHGLPPRWIPNDFHAACVRELLKRGDQIWRDAYLMAIKVFSDIAADEELEPKDRLRAAQYVVERIAGKVPERLEVTAADPWETIISGIVAEAEDESITRAARVLSGEKKEETP